MNSDRSLLRKIINSCEVFRNEAAYLGWFINMHKMPSTLHNDHGAVWEERLVERLYLCFVLWESPGLCQLFSCVAAVDEQAWALISLQIILVIESSNACKVVYYRVQMDGPLYSLVVFCAIVNYIARYEVGNGCILKLIFDNLNGHFSCTPLNLQASDLL